MPSRPLLYLHRLAIQVHTQGRAIEVHTQLVHHSYSCTHLVHPTRAPLVLVHLSCITHTRAPISCTSTLVHPSRATPISCTSRAPPCSTRTTLVHYSRAPLSCTTQSFLNCRGTSLCLAVGTSTRVPSCTTSQSRAPLHNLLHLWCTAMLHSYHSRALLSCTPHKLPQLSWHFPLPGLGSPTQEASSTLVHHSNTHNSHC